MITMPRNRHDLKAVFATAVLGAMTLAPTVANPDTGFVTAAVSTILLAISHKDKIKFEDADTKAIRAFFRRKNRDIDPKHENIIGTIDYIADETGIPTPEIVFEDNVPYIAYTENDDTIFLNKQLFSSESPFSEDEQDVAVAHELSHMRNHDSDNSITALNFLLLNSVTTISNIITTNPAALLGALATACSVIVSRYNARQQEFSADIEATKIVENKEDLASVFKAIDNVQHTLPKPEKNNSKILDFLEFAYQNHPSDDVRIKNLQQLKL